MTETVYGIHFCKANQEMV